LRSVEVSFDQNIDRDEIRASDTKKDMGNEVRKGELEDKKNWEKKEKMVVVEMRVYRSHIEGEICSTFFSMGSEFVWGSW
jgi:hypothetical protein